MGKGEMSLRINQNYIYFYSVIFFAHKSKSILMDNHELWLI